MCGFLTLNSVAGLLNAVGLPRSLEHLSIAIRRLRLRIRRPYQLWVHEAANWCMSTHAGRGPGCPNAV